MADKGVTVRKVKGLCGDGGQGQASRGQRQGGKAGRTLEAHVKPYPEVKLLKVHAGAMGPLWS